MTKALDLAGQTFNHLTALHRVAGKGRVKWAFQCSCGNQTISEASKVKSGHTKSCGCNGVKTLSYGPFISRAQSRAQGLVHYFTGKPCNKGHVALRTNTRGCMECSRIESLAAHQLVKNDPVFRAEKASRTRAWSRKNPEKVKANSKKQFIRDETDPKRKAVKRLRCLIKNTVIKYGGRKAAKTEELLGCSIIEARVHLEAQFQKGMNWDNHGEWHIDHIRPCASFSDLTKKEQQLEVCHYTNLQPLWAADNIRKSDKWEQELQAA